MKALLLGMNKATAATVAGAVVTIIGSYFALDTEIAGAIQTLLTAVLVWRIPNLK